MMFTISQTNRACYVINIMRSKAERLPKDILDKTLTGFGNKFNWDDRESEEYIKNKNFGSVLQN